MKKFGHYLHLCWRFLQVVFKHFIDDGCMYRSAGLTYTTLLSLVPLMTVSFAIFSAFPVFQNLSNRIQDFIFSHFVAASGQVIQTYLTHFVSQTSKLSSIGMIFLVITAVLMMFNMEQAFNSIWHVKKRRNAISAFMLYWAVLTLSPVFVGISLIVSSYVASISFVSVTVTTLGLTKPAIDVVPFILSIAAFTLIYVTVPNCSVPIRYGFVGAVIAAIMFEIAKEAFGLYVANFPTYTMLYGALATIPIFLIWLYTSWLIILFGAVISNVLTVGYQYRSEHKMDGFTQVYRWLGYLWYAMHEGRSMSLRDLINMDPSDYQIIPERQLEFMIDAKLIQPTSSGHYVLSQDLSEFTLKDLLLKLPWRLPTKDELEPWDAPWEDNLKKVVDSIIGQTNDILNTPLAKMYEGKKPELPKKKRK